MPGRSFNFTEKEINVLIASLARMASVQQEKTGTVRAEVAALLKKLNRSQKTITTASAKDKGRNLQKWICQQIADGLTLPYDQQDDQCLIHSREMGQAGSDIVLRGEAFTRFPFTVECKNQETVSLPAFVEQAQSNVHPGTDWLLVVKNKRFNPPLAIMAWASFAKLVFKKGS